MKIEADTFQVAKQSSSKFHRAAVDGYIDMLCDASKRDTNLPNEHDGLTPTLTAAQSGQLDALRILVGRGGDPEKTSADGSSALHLAAVRGHLNCVSFLVNFGVNMWSLDNDLHTAKDAAAIEHRKEVLDFLDQMMAKQSALNTKNVQKLKEKAKVAAEKRIKQLRKAQMKAIKQVEKDERYLMKLSHNRRLLKAAHSISDIKLVGRHHHQPLDAGRLPNYLSPLTSAVDARTSGISSSSSSSRLSTSPSLANLLSQKLQTDLFGARSKPQQHNQQLAASRLLSRHSTTGSCTDDTSAYSTSSVSSYLSSAGSTSPKRPKYSDLVAVNGAELAKWQDRKKPPSTEQQSLKSSSTASTIGTKFWGIGGVSRKVQLRRLLKAGSAVTQSSSDLTSSASDCQQESKTDCQTEANPNSSGEQRLLEGDAAIVRSSNSKLCNVQPAIKLKLNTTEPRAPPDDNKWPHFVAPMSLARAKSEPDFGVALRDGENELVANSDTRLSTPSEPEILEDKSHARASANQCQNEPASGITARLAPAPPQQQLPATRNHSQQQLLNQCLSQLKLRHEALTMRKEQAEPNSGQLLRPSKLSACSKLLAPDGGCQKRSAATTGGHVFGGNSDELIQHQLHAGQFPLRPSLIKQKQLQSRELAPNDSIQRHTQCQQQQQQQNATRSTTISVDSIGSATSFAKRNSRSSSASAKSSDLSSPTTSYSSAYTSSSTETAALVINTAKSDDEHPSHEKALQLDNKQQQRPSPPPLPPKTLSSVPVDSSAANQIVTRKQKPRHSSNQLSKEVPKRVIEPSIETFLESNGLGDLKQVFATEEIDLEALVLLTEDDLKSLNILLGPRRKLLKAIDNERRRADMAHGNNRATTTLHDATKPMYVVVDTQL